jgi:hypothetical protein
MMIALTVETSSNHKIQCPKNVVCDSLQDGALDLSPTEIKDTLPLASVFAFLNITSNLPQLTHDAQIHL